MGSTTRIGITLGDPSGIGPEIVALALENAPAGLRKAIVIFTDGEDSECADIDNCRAKRGRVIDRANAADISLFTIGLSSQVDFEALGELARGTDLRFEPLGVVAPRRLPDWELFEASIG